MKRKHLIIVLYAMLAFAVGMAREYFYPGQAMSPVDLWTMPLSVFLVFWWYWLDTVQHAFRRSPWLNVGVVALSLIALPCYFFRSRGFRRGAIATGLFLLAVLASGVLTLIGQYATYYGVQNG